MKTVLLLLIASFSLNVFAAKLEAVDCKREMIAGALAADAKNTTLEALLISDFAVSDFNYYNPESGFGDFDYVVTIELTNRADKTTMTRNYGVKVKSVKKCSVKTQLFAG